MDRVGNRVAQGNVGEEGKGIVGKVPRKSPIGALAFLDRWEPLVGESETIDLHPRRRGLGNAVGTGKLSEKIIEAVIFLVKEDDMIDRRSGSGRFIRRKGDPRKRECGNSAKEERGGRSAPFARPLGDRSEEPHQPEHAR